MKKIFTLVLALVMTSAVAAGCGTKPAANIPVPSAAATQAPTATPAPTEAATAAPTEAAATQEAAQTDTPSASKFDLASAPQITITVMGHDVRGTRSATEDVLTPIWREKTKVTVKSSVFGDDKTEADQTIQQLDLGNQLPDVLAPTNGCFDNDRAMDYMVKQKVLREITLQDIKDYMPLTVARLNAMGVSIEDWYEANRARNDIRDGKLYYIPGAPAPLTTNLKDDPNFRWQAGFEPYFFYIRDDVLKAIYPNVKTEAELRISYRRWGRRISTIGSYTRITWFRWIRTIVLEFDSYGAETGKEHALK